MSDPIIPFQILALSGGGFRGLFTARILADIEEEIGAPIATRFDLIAGTSIGGILALALALEIPAINLVKLFEKNGNKIFKKQFSLGGLWSAPYTLSALHELLSADDLFGNRTLGNCKHRIIIPSINYSTGLPVIFKTPHHPNFVRDYKHRLVDVALATSAAPGFFPRHVFDDCQYVDGGLYANAPGLLAAHEAQHFLDQKRNALRVVSIGTMSSKFTVDPRRERSGGVRDWGRWWPPNMPKRLFGVAISAHESMVHNILSHRFPSSQYFHIDEDLTDERARAVALDKTDSSAQEVLLGAAKQCSKGWLGNSAFRELLKYKAPSALFHRGPNANIGEHHA